MSSETHSEKRSGDDASEPFVDLVAEISSLLIGATGDELEPAIATVLERIGGHFDLDRVTVWEVRRGEAAVTGRLLSGWAAPGTEIPSGLFSEERFPWTARRLLGGQPVQFSDPSELPEDAATDRRTFEILGTRANLSIPLTVGPEITAILSLGVLHGRRDWSDLSSNRVEVLRDLLAATFARMDAYRRQRLSDARFKNYVQQTSEGVWCMEFGKPLPLDLPEDEAIEQIYQNARMVEADDAFARMYGFESVREMGTWRLNEYLPRDSTTMEMLRTAVRSGYRLEALETHEIAKDGTTRIFLNSIYGEITEGQLSRIWGTQRDQTETLTAHELLSQNEAFLGSLVDSLVDELAVLDQHGKIVRVNRAWRDFADANNAPSELSSGIGYDYLLACRNAAAAGDVSAAECLAGIGKVLRGEQEEFTKEYQCEGTAAGDRWFRFRVMPLRAADGGVVTVHSDITVQRTRDATLREQRAQLAHLIRVTADPRSRASPS